MSQKPAPSPQPVRINLPYWEVRRIAAAITAAAAAAGSSAGPKPK